MKTWIIVTLIIVAVLIIAAVTLVVLKKVMSKKKEKNIKLAENMGNTQTMNLFIIDKAKKKPTEANLSQNVVESLPKAIRKTKLPVVKAKVGPKIMTLVCDDGVFEQLLPKQEVKAKMAGAVIVSATRIRGPVANTNQTKTKKKEVFI